MPAPAMSSGIVMPNARSVGEISTIFFSTTVPPGTLRIVSFSSVMLPHSVRARMIGARIEPT